MDTADGQTPAISDPMFCARALGCRQPGSRLHCTHNRWKMVGFLNRLPTPALFVGPCVQLFHKYPSKHWHTSVSGVTPAQAARKASLMMLVDTSVPSHQLFQTSAVNVVQRILQLLTGRFQNRLSSNFVKAERLLYQTLQTLDHTCSLPSPTRSTHLSESFSPCISNKTSASYDRKSKSCFCLTIQLECCTVTQMQCKLAISKKPGHAFVTFSCMITWKLLSRGLQKFPCLPPSLPDVPVSKPGSSLLKSCLKYTDWREND